MTRNHTTGSDPARGWWRWLQVWSYLGSPGLFLAIVMWGPRTVLTVFACAVVAAVGGSVDPGSARAHLGRTTWIRRGVATATVVQSTAAVSAVSVWGGVLVVCVTLLSCPLVTALACGAPRPALAGPTPGAPVPTTAESPLDVGLLHLSDVELRRAWRRSYVVLDRAVGVAEKTTVVRVRQAYLDELEVRDAAGLRAWLQSGARAASGPERFLADGGR